MSYPRTLDEIPEAELEQELLRRYKRQNDKLCDYCSQAYDTKPCKFPFRHVGREQAFGFSKLLHFAKMLLQADVEGHLDSRSEHGSFVLMRHADTTRELLKKLEA